MNHLTRKNMAPSIKDDLHSYAWAFFDWALTTTVSENIPFPILSDMGPNNSHIWILGELHNINETEWLTEFPDSQTLKKHGISKITFAIEGQPAGIVTTFETLIKRRTLIEQLEYRAKKLHLTTKELLNRQPLPEGLKKSWAAGNITDNLALLNLIRKLQELEKNGIKINLQGLEAKTYNPLDD